MKQTRQTLAQWNFSAKLQIMHHIDKQATIYDTSADKFKWKFPNRSSNIFLLPIWNNFPKLISSVGNMKKPDTATTLKRTHESDSVSLNLLLADWAKQWIQTTFFTQSRAGIQWGVWKRSGENYFRSAPPAFHEIFNSPKFAELISSRPYYLSPGLRGCYVLI